MTAAELVISLVLSAAGFAASIKKAEGQLDGVGDAAREAGRDMSAAAADAAADLRDVARQADKTGDALEDAAVQGSGGFRRFAAVVGSALAVLGGVSALKDVVAHYFDAAGAVGLASDRLGLGVDALQAWQGAAVAAGGDADELTTKMADLGDWMQDLVLHDSGPLKDVTADLGVSFQAADGQAVDLEEGLLRLSDAMSRVSRQKATGLLTQIGFDERTIPLLLKGRRELEALLKVQRERAPYTKEDIANAERQRHAQQRLDQAWEGLSATLARLVAPAVIFLSDKLADLLGWVTDNKQFVLIFLGGLAAVIGTAVVPALTAMAAAAWAAMAPFLPFIALIAGAALVIDDLITYINGGESALADLWAVFGTGEEIGARFAAIWDNAKTYLSAVLGILGGIKDFWVAIFSADMEGVVGALRRVYDNLVSIKDVFANLFGYIKDKLTNLLPDWAKKLLGVSGDEAAPVSGGVPAAPAAVAPPGGVPMQASHQTWSGAGAVDNSRTVTSTTSVNTVNVYSQATDAEGVARDMVPALRNQTAQADGAFAG